MVVYVRELTAEEHAKLGRLVHAQTAPVRLARRARIIHLAVGGASVAAIARQLGVTRKAVRPWIARFNAAGLAGLEDAPRAGRPATYSEETRSRVIAKARGRPPKPAEGPLPPTCHWTLDLLQRELNREGLPIKRSQIRRILDAEHIAWRKPRTWLESDDPDFAGKGPASSSSTPSHRVGAPSSA